MESLQDKWTMVFAHKDSWATEDHEHDLLLACKRSKVWKTQQEVRWPSRLDG